MANPNFSSKILIRKLEDDSIVVFYDKHSIYVKSQMGILVFSSLVLHKKDIILKILNHFLKSRNEKST